MNTLGNFAAILGFFGFIFLFISISGNGRYSKIFFNLSLFLFMMSLVFATMNVVNPETTGTF